MADTINVYEAKTQLSRLLTRVENGEEIVISRNGRPVAKLGALTTGPTSRQPGAWRGKIRISDDFDEFTLDDEKLWYGK